MSPIGRGLASMEGAYVIGFELVAFLPLFAWALWPRRGGRSIEKNEVVE